MVSVGLTDPGTRVYAREPATLSTIESDLDSWDWHLPRIKNRELENKIISTFPVLTWVGTSVSRGQQCSHCPQKVDSQRCRTQSQLQQSYTPPNSSHSGSFVSITGTCFLPPLLSPHSSTKRHPCLTDRTEAARLQLLGFPPQLRTLMMPTYG